MNVEMPSLSEKAIVVAGPESSPGWFLDILVLVKLRVNIFVVATAFVGFALNTSILSNWLLLLHTLIGTGLVACGAAAANQALEWRFDQDMVRTHNRPLAAGRFYRRTGVWVSVIFLTAGCLWLDAAINLRAVLLAFLTFLIYVFAYTPLKRFTSICILVGAVAGALPVLIGWAATGADFGLWTAVAFTILFLWQIPHFLAIAWSCRLDYLRAGFHVLPFDDQRGYWTAGSAFVFATTTVVVSFVPVWLHRVTDWYFLGGFALGTVILFFSTRFLMKRTIRVARSLFIISLIYLPCLYLLMLLCKKQP
ncbi:MAG TPA: heme o synthase [Verrucomicrobiae bacterium]|nr:heme o synthase [Verrucomicrobiae bacterium]